MKDAVQVTPYSDETINVSYRVKQLFPPANQSSRSDRVFAIYARDQRSIRAAHRRFITMTWGTRRTHIISSESGRSNRRCTTM